MFLADHLCRCLGLGGLHDSSAGRLALLYILRVVVNPSMAPRHVVLAVIGTTEAVAWERAVAWWVLAKRFFVAVHFVRFTLVPEETSSRRELKIRAFIMTTTEGLEVGVNVLVILALQHFGFMTTILSGQEGAMIEAISMRSSVVKRMAPWRDDAFSR